MIIALVVSLAAIFASEQVKTAFFKLNSINQQITELQARQRDLEAKVNTGRLVLPVDTLMVPFYRIIPQSASASRASRDDSRLLFFRGEVRQRELSAARLETLRDSAGRR